MTKNEIKGDTHTDNPGQGVYYCNGHLVKRHKGGFLTWDRKDKKWYVALIMPTALFRKASWEEMDDAGIPKDDRGSFDLKRNPDVSIVPETDIIKQYPITMNEAFDPTLKRRSGYLVETKSGKMGRTYHDETAVKGKVRVHVVDEDYNPTGEKLLCSHDTMKFKGYID